MTVRFDDRIATYTYDMLGELELAYAVTVHKSQGSEFDAVVRAVGMEPYYPVNDEKNNALYEQYKKLADEEENVIFGGRLGNYKYYDMDKVIAAALEQLDRIV